MNAVTTFKRITKCARRRRSLNSLLDRFGFRAPVGKRSHFWERYSVEIEWIFRDCWQNYRKQAKSAHPDNGGSHDVSAELNAAWTELEKRFRKNCRGLAMLPAVEVECEIRARKRAPVKFRFDTAALAKASKKLGISTAGIRDRICNGWSLDEALSEPLQPKGNKSMFSKFALASERIGVSTAVIRERIRRGWSMEKATTTPAVRKRIPARAVAALITLWALVLSPLASEPFRMLSTTAAEQTNAVLCLISWNTTPPPFDVVHYSVYQASAVEGPYELIATTDTNEITLVVEAGTHFWNVRALCTWSGEITTTSTPSASVGMIDGPTGGVGVKKVHPQNQPNRVPDALLIPLGMSMPVPATNQAFTRARSVPQRVPKLK